MFRHELSYIHIASFFALLQVGCQPFFEQSSQGFLVWQIFLVACGDLGLFGFFFFPPLNLAMWKNFFRIFPTPFHLVRTVCLVCSLGLLHSAPDSLPSPSLPYNVVSLAVPRVIPLEHAALQEPGLLTLFQKKEVLPLPPDFSQARPGPPPTCLCSHTCLYLNLPLDHSLPFLSCRHH